MADYIDLRPITDNQKKIVKNQKIIANSLDEAKKAIEQVSLKVGAVEGRVVTVDDKVAGVASELADLAREFNEFVGAQRRANRLGVAETRVVKIRQEIEKRFGHYDRVRRAVIGILQATDLGIIRENTMRTASENLMIETPGYWLAPALVALSAWICDERELADKALREAIDRDDEKTCMFFALVCRRADRKPSSVKWVRRYLDNQSANDMNAHAAVLIDAFSNGLFGPDVEHGVTECINGWIEELEAQPGFTDHQRNQWRSAFMLKVEPVRDSEYPTMAQASPTWPALKASLERAKLHREVFGYLDGVFSKKTDPSALKTKMDDLLLDLSSRYDGEEADLRRKEQVENLVIKYEGDEGRAVAEADEEGKVFDERKDFSRVLVDMSMRPQVAGVSADAQKYAIALSHEWVEDAYLHMKAENDQQIPAQIDIEHDGWKGSTADGRNEAELVVSFSAYNGGKLQEALAAAQAPASTQVKLYAGIGVAVLGAFLLLFVPLLGVICLIAGIWMAITAKGALDGAAKAQDVLRASYREKEEQGAKAVRALCAEAYDYRDEFEERNGESRKVLELLDGLKPEEFVKASADGIRRVAG